MSSKEVHRYNSVIDFKLNQVRNFPDFTIELTKTDKIQGPNNAKWSRQTFFFTVVADDFTQELTWTTGRTQNTKFKVNNSDYELVMGSYLDSEDKSITNLELNQLMIIQPKKVKLSKQNIKTGDIVLRSTKRKHGEALFTEYGTIEKTLLGLFVYDLRNTIKQPLKTWSSQSIDKQIAVFRKTSVDFQTSQLELKGGSFNYLFDSDDLVLVTKNF